MQNRTYEGKRVRIILIYNGYPDEVMKTIKENVGKTGYIPTVDGVYSEFKAYDDGDIKTEDIYYKVRLDGTNESIIIPGRALEVC